MIHRGWKKYMQNSKFKKKKKKKTKAIWILNLEKNISTETLLSKYLVYSK